MREGVGWGGRGGGETQGVGPVVRKCKSKGAMILGILPSQWMPWRWCVVLSLPRLSLAVSTANAYPPALGKHLPLATAHPVRSADRNSSERRAFPRPLPLVDKVGASQRPRSRTGKKARRQATAARRTGLGPGATSTRWIAGRHHAHTAARPRFKHENKPKELISTRPCLWRRAFTLGTHA
ncbi:hypothetical protein BS50DRAFT_81549 [Corynespora cassiicola Philippines]|uniref:Uncharacterized protein n=1 Tax=Corynespora cassiicola Philippines TaxID=1448308 RepID=A0A2T2NHE5_CORCC|nr:hypothetical protein BS50DRAFT_81549 [Corynespora cassiicola Philippines]